ncbi:hypothetical protein AWZ03_013502, partial [Drosophila navojoa]
LKVADFGLARTLCTRRRSNADLDCKEELDNEAMLTDYVATRWYRAPEILVASRKYTKGIDMWSLGCILGEMIRQKPLFQGTSTINQIEKIVSALPEVTDRDIESIGASFGSVLLSKKIVRDRRYSLDEILRNCCDDALSLVKSLLVLDPEGRLTAKEAIAHSYVHRFRTSSANMELRADIRPPLDDDTRYGVDEYRSTLYEMIAPELRSSESHSSTTPVISTASSDQPSSQTPSDARSESKSRPSASSSQSTVQTDPSGPPISPLTKAWVEEQQKQQHFHTQTQLQSHQHQHSHPHHHQHPHSHLLQQQQQQQQHLTHQQLQKWQRQRQRQLQQERIQQHQLRVQQQLQEQERRDKLYEEQMIKVRHLQEQQQRIEHRLAQQELRRIEQLLEREHQEKLKQNQQPQQEQQQQQQQQQQQEQQQQQQEQQQQQQQQQQEQQQQKQQQKQQEQQQHGSKRCSSESRYIRRPGESAHVALRRELAAAETATATDSASATATATATTSATSTVAATAPRCIGGVWRTPVKSHSGTVVPPLHLWEESPPAASEVEVVGEGLCSTAHLRARVRKLRRECKERRIAKAKAEEQHRRSIPRNQGASHPAESANKYKEHIARPRQVSPSGLAKSRTAAFKQQLKEYAQTKAAERHHSKALRFDPAHRHAPAPRRSSSNSSDSSRTMHACSPILGFAPSDAVASQNPSAEEQQRRDQKSVELSTALERMQLEHRELQQKKCNSNDADGGNQRTHLPPKHQMRKMVRESTGNAVRFQRHPRRASYLSPGTRPDRFFTPDGTIRPVDKVVSVDEKTDHALQASNASAAFICYKTRLLRLEEEMAKCKRQLFHYVQDNQQLLNKQGLRHHIERLLHSPTSAQSNKCENTPILPSSIVKSTVKTPQSDSGVEADHPKLDRDKQKQLQLREFLARDESDANAYELPNLSNVYKTSSCHVPPLFDCHGTSTSGRPPSSMSTHTKGIRASSLVQHSHKLAHAYSNYFPVGSTKAGYENVWHKRHHAHGHNAKRHHSLAPKCDRLRIQEANFVDGYNGSHATRK